MGLKTFTNHVAIITGAGQGIGFEIARQLCANGASVILNDIDDRLATEAAKKINEGLMQAERNWLNPDGIPGRPWFKHILYGARYTYAHLELPGLTEAVEKGDWKTAGQQAAILQRAIANNTQLMNSLNAEFSGKN